MSLLAPHMPSKRLTKHETAQMSPSGNSPVMITKGHLLKVVPLWHDLGVAINKDESAREVRSLSAVLLCGVLVCCPAALPARVTSQSRL